MFSIYHCSDHCELEGVSARDEDHHHRVIILDCSGITSIDSVGADGLMKVEHCVTFQYVGFDLLLTSDDVINFKFLLRICNLT